MTVGVGHSAAEVDQRPAGTGARLARSGSLPSSASSASSSCWPAMTSSSWRDTARPASPRRQQGHDVHRPQRRAAPRPRSGHARGKATPRARGTGAFPRPPHARAPASATGGPPPEDATVRRPGSVAPCAAWRDVGRRLRPRGALRRRQSRHRLPDLDGSTGQPWYSQWYATPEFGNLRSGTGLLLDMGETVTVTERRGWLSAARRGRTSRCAWETALTLADLPPVASASGVGGTVRLTATPRPAAGTYWSGSPGCPPTGRASTRSTSTA